MPAASTAQPSARICFSGVPPSRGASHSGDHAQVEDHRGQRRHSKPLEAVQRPAGQRGERDEQQEREGQPEQVHQQAVLGRVGVHAAGEQHGQLRGEDQRQRGDQQQHPAQGAGHARHQLAQVFMRTGFLHFGEHRHEGGGEGALGEQPAQEIGDPEGHPEGIGHRIGAEGRGDDLVADQPQHPRHHGHAAE